VRGILTLGKFLIWLVVFLFFFSSFLVLIQFGSNNYVPKMTSGWGSVAQEFEKSYHTLSATQPETVAGNTATATAGGAAVGTQAQPGEVPQSVSLLLWGGVVICLLSFFWMVAVAFQESMLWGLAVLFIPPVAIIYWITHFREATPPFVIGVIGVVVLFFTVTHYGVNLVEFFMGTSTPPPAKTPNPLEGMILPLIFIIFR